MTLGAPPKHPLRTLADLLGMIRFSHTLFALPFAVLGALMASYRPEGPWRGGLKEWSAILVCMVAARSSAMAFNRLVDRSIDARNPRTASRHLPSGRLSVRSVVVFTVANVVVFVASTALFLPENPWPIRLSAPVLLWLLGYSFAKRWTSLAHYWLGLALAMAPIAAWIAIRGGLSWPPVLLGLGVLCWVGGFDIIYACQDFAFDRASGLRSIPARLGIRGALAVAAASHAAMIAALVGVGFVYPPFGTIYWLGLGAVAALLLFEHALVRPDDLGRVNQAFFHVNVGISLGLLAIGALDLAV